MDTYVVFCINTKAYAYTHVHTHVRAHAHTNTHIHTGEQYIKNAIRNARAGPESEVDQELSFYLHNITAVDSQWPAQGLFMFFRIVINPSTSGRLLLEEPTYYENGPPCEASTVCGDISFHISADYAGLFEVTLMAQDNGGQANDGIDASFRSFLIGITSVNDVPNFVYCG